MSFYSSTYPTNVRIDSYRGSLHRENRVNGKKGKKSIGNFVCSGIKFPGFKGKGLKKNCYKIQQYCFKKATVSGKSVWHMKQSQITEIGTGTICGWTGGKFQIQI